MFAEEDKSYWYLALADGCAEEQLQAVAHLVQSDCKTRRVLFLLQRGLNDSDMAVTKACLDAIEQLFPEEWEAAVWNLWANPQATHRTHAAEILATRLGVDGVDALFAKLNAIEAAMYPQAWEALVRFHAERLLGYTLQWTRHPQWMDRCAAVQSMLLLPAQGWELSSQQERVKQPCVVRLVELCLDVEEQVRCVALRTLTMMDRSRGLSCARAALQDTQGAVRLAALECFSIIDDDALLPEVLVLRQDSYPGVRSQVLLLWERWGRDDAYLSSLREAIRDESDDVKQVAAEKLGVYGSIEDLHSIKTLFLCDRVDVADVAMNAICQLSSGQELVEAMLDGLTHPSEDILDQVRQIVQNEMVVEYWDERMPEEWVARLPKTRGYAATYALSQIKSRWPTVWQSLCALDQLSSFPWPEEERARLAVLSFFAQEEYALAMAILERGILDPLPTVRAESLRLLAERDANRARQCALGYLSDEIAGVRCVAVRCVAHGQEPWAVDLLLPKTRDPDAFVRKAALEALVPFRDPRILAEWVSSLQDVDATVRWTAHRILHNQWNGEVPLIQPLEEKRVVPSRPRWQELRDQAENIRQWASDIGQQLLGKMVRIHQHRQGFGYTVQADSRGPIDIYVSDTSVTRGHPHGEQIMKGLALHEIGHHLFDIGVRGFSTMQGIARSEGIKEIFDILIDERMERGLRSRRPEWGIFFDRLASYAFVQTEHKIPLHEYAALLEWEPTDVLVALQQKQIPGTFVQSGVCDREVKIRLRDCDLLAIPKAIPPLYAFLWCFRCGLDPGLFYDSCVARAIEKIPGHLKDLNHAQLLQLSREIGHEIGTMQQNREALERTNSLLNECPHLRGMWGRLERGLSESQRLVEGMFQAAGEIRRNIVVESHERRPRPRVETLRRGGRTINVGASLEFPAIQREEELKPDVFAYTQRLVTIRKYIRKMRSFFERLGRQTVEVYASRRGRRLDMAQVRSMVLLQKPNVLVDSVEDTLPDLYVGLLIDRSGSMAGERMNRAQMFASLFLESTRGLRGIVGHIHAFDDSTLYRLGDLQQRAIADLEAMGGNNDAGALQRAAELALQSRKRRRLLIVISDGMPTECTAASLQKLVHHLSEEKGILCAQVAVEPLQHICFPHHLDVSQYELDEAVSRFGQLLIRLNT